MEDTLTASSPLIKNFSCAFLSPSSQLQSLPFLQYCVFLDKYESDTSSCLGAQEKYFFW